MKEIIKRVQATLKWQVSTIKHETRHMEITSDPIAKTHTIYIPPPEAEWRDIEYLHELGHAYLAEQTHPLFSSAYFAKGTPDQEMQKFIWPKRTADDWYVDDLLIQWCPDEERAEIEEHADMIKYVEEETSPFWLYGAGLMLAQAIEYRVEHPVVPESVKPVIDALRSFRPNCPNIRNLRRLTNKLALLVTTKQIELAHEDRLDVWKIV